MRQVRLVSERYPVLVSRFRKEWHFDPDQPRGHHGEWTAGGVAHSLEHVLSRHPHVETHATEDEHGIRISMIRTADADRGQGHASRALKDILDYADSRGKMIALSPEAVGRGGLSTPALRRWYASHGFVPNKGRRADFRFTESMIRQPQR